MFHLNCIYKCRKKAYCVRRIFYTANCFSQKKTLSRKSRNLTAQKMKFSIKDFFSRCDQIRKKLLIWSHLLKKSLLEKFIFCARKCLHKTFRKKNSNHVIHTDIGAYQKVKNISFSEFFLYALKR